MGILNRTTYNWWCAIHNQDYDECPCGNTKKEPDNYTCEFCEDTGYIGMWTCRECSHWSDE